MKKLSCEIYYDIYVYIFLNAVYIIDDLLLVILNGKTGVYEEAGEKMNKIERRVFFIA